MTGLLHPKARGSQPCSCGWHHEHCSWREMLVGREGPDVKGCGQCYVIHRQTSRLNITTSRKKVPRTQHNGGKMCLYFESHCPYCAQFHQILFLFASEHLESIVDTCISRPISSMHVTTGHCGNSVRNSERAFLGIIL
jgi:hypothetical protein